MKTHSFLRWFGLPSQSDLKASAEVPPAEREDAQSHFEREQRLEKGQEVFQDAARAAEYYLKAAVQGHTAAQFSLGLMYGRGRGPARPVEPMPDLPAF